jgi:hypothetical protein
MTWLLRLFSTYRYVESEKDHIEQNCRTLQAQNAALERENERLSRQYEAEREDRISLAKRHENVLMQTAYGCKPVYPEEFHLPERRHAEPGPVPTNRIFGHDAVKEQEKQFFADVIEFYNKPA